MSYSAFSEDRKSLQFPAFCDGYVRVDYSDAIATEVTGLWKNNGSITAEMIVTPYDVNGDSDQNLFSVKTVQTDSNYFPSTERINSAMTLFKNTNMKVTLNNVSTIRKRNPAEYTISFTLKIGSTTTTITSPTVITTTPVVRKVYLNPSNFLFVNHQPYAELANVNGSSDTISTVKISTDSPNPNSFITNKHAAYAVGMKVYDENNNDLGTVQSINTGTGLITVQNIGTTFTKAFTPIRKDATYIEVPHHIAVSYDSINENMSIIYNNNVVVKSKHGSGGKFILDPSDIYLGQDPTGTAQEKRKSQFFGEYHEIAISSISVNNFTNINTLSPIYRKLLLYLDFEESNLDG
tara:strand:- start:518 stop:1567 length:1050 start_codon:yes stop_codon:yes gene_type:complete